MKRLQLRSLKSESLLSDESRCEFRNKKINQDKKIESNFIIIFIIQNKVTDLFTEKIV